MSKHCERSNLIEKMQSAYRRGHSTETVLLKICDDILRGIVNQQVTMMALFDLSAVF